MGGPQKSYELLSRVIQIGHMTVTLIIVYLLFQALRATLRIRDPLHRGKWLSEQYLDGDVTEPVTEFGSLIGHQCCR
jgi:hypothetical protein